MTTGIAILDFEGNLLFTESKKNFKHSEITSRIYEYGIPIIMASDKFPLPETIKNISASLPSKLSYPRQSLTRIEKVEMTQPFIEDKKPWSNQHERDALAAATFAHNRIKPLLKRIEKKVDSQEANDFVRMNVILKGINIDSSIKKFEQR